MKAGIWGLLALVAALSAGLAARLIWLLLVEPQQLLAWTM